MVLGIDAGAFLHTTLGRILFVPCRRKVQRSFALRTRSGQPIGTHWRERSGCGETTACACG
jgi:hypothetical protein